MEVAAQTLREVLFMVGWVIIHPTRYYCAKQTIAYLLMANKNTKRARRAGFPSRRDQEAAGNNSPHTTITKGIKVNTSRRAGKNKWLARKAT